MYFIPFYISSIAAGAVVNNYYTIRNYLEAYKKNITNLEFTDELSYEAKGIDISLKIYICKEVIKQNLVNILPLYNVVASLTRLLTNGIYVEAYDKMIKDSVDLMNELEEKNRIAYYKVYRDVINELNLKTKLDLNELHYVPYSEIKKFLDAYGLELSESIEDDKTIVKEIDINGKTYTYTYNLDN